MNLQYVERALCFHGAPLQKIWDNERGADDLQRLGVPAQPNYEIYQQRQRFFTFQDRAKRLKLHQFFARKAKDLYDIDLKKYANVPDEKLLEKSRTSFVTMPPFENFACDPNDKDRKYQQVLQSLKPGDVVYGVFVKAGLFTNQSHWTLKPLCTGEPLVRYLNHLPIKGCVLPQDYGPPPLDENNKIRSYLISDFVRCEVVRVSIEVDRILLGFNKFYNEDPNIELGLVKRDDLPLYYDKAHDCATQNYEQCLRESKEFLNPNYEVLYSMNGLDINDTFSLMGALKLPFPAYEMAKELRKAQAHKWAFRSVAEGIELFKNGQHLEAFQCLNKALSIDPYNVEGLVARGALFANRGSFHKAVDDFGNALKLDKFHANARKYMGETLVALGRSLEEDKRFDEAAKAYKDCLELIPHHAQAMGCLEGLNQRLTGSLLDSAFFDNLLNIPAATALKPPPDFEMSNDAPAKATNSSTTSEDSSSDSSSSDSDENAAKTKPSKFEKVASLSPLSKRMALHAASLRGDAVISNSEAPPPPPKMVPIRYDQPFFASRTSTIDDANDFRLDDDDTQSRVLKLLEQATAHKKQKKKKTKKSKSKKSKKDSKKSEKSVSDDISSDIQQGLFQSNYLLETFKNIGNDNFQSKLTKDINSYEHKIAEIQKKQEMLRQSMQETPPPPPPMNMQSKIHLNLSKANSKSSAATAPSSAASSGSATSEANRFSFQIRKTVKVDKFGLVRIATPLKQHSPSPASQVARDEKDKRDSSRRRSSRSRTRSPHRRHRSRSRRSRSSSYRRGRYGRSRSRSKSRHRSRRSRDSRESPSSKRRRSRSPFLRRRSRSRSYEKRSYKKSDPNYWESNRMVSRSIRSPPIQNKNNKFGNRVWQRPGYEPPPPGVSENEANSMMNERWQHDKFEEINSDRPPAAPAASKASKEEGPSIEEIDEIIKKAQKERKAEIIKRDNEILKRPDNGRF